MRPAAARFAMPPDGQAVGRTASGPDAVLIAPVVDEQLSLSRLNHWLPRGQADPEVMQGTADFHHDITDALLPQADPVFDDAATLDAAVGDVPADVANGRALLINDYAASPVQARAPSLVVGAKRAA